MTGFGDRRLIPIDYPERRVISASQNHEDVILNRCFRGATTGTYVDVGAGDPNWDSVTWWFYRQGWSGINVEPNPLFAPQYARFRERDVNLCCGIGTKVASLTFYAVEPDASGQGWGLSSFDVANAEQAAASGFQVDPITVEVRPLSDILDEHLGDRRVDFLKVDVEGRERDVLESADLKRTRPRVIAIEAVRPLSTQPSHVEWEDLLLEAGYQFGLFDGINAYYVHEDSCDELLSQLNASVNFNDGHRAAEAKDFDEG